MKKLYKTVLAALIINLFAVNSALAVTPEDYGNVIKITKKMCRLANKNKISELGEFYSKDYKSFDGYNKEEILKIYEIANKLYPNTKTKEKITKIETENDFIKVYIDEVSTTKINVEGEDTAYASKDKVKGEMKSTSSYSMTFKEEDGVFKVVSDEIYSEITDIRYGEAINADFEMEAPKAIKPGEEFTVKTTLEMPEGRFVVGSIGHDKIVFPSEKYLDPFRAVNKTGILERVMIANEEGKNEYANSTFTFIAPYTAKKDDETKKGASVSGMGIYIRRLNTVKEVL